MAHKMYKKGSTENTAKNKVIEVKPQSTLKDNDAITKFFKNPIGSGIKPISKK